MNKLMAAVLMVGGLMVSGSVMAEGSVYNAYVKPQVDQEKQQQREAFQPPAAFLKTEISDDAGPSNSAGNGLTYTGGGTSGSSGDTGDDFYLGGGDDGGDFIMD